MAVCRFSNQIDFGKNGFNVENDGCHLVIKTRLGANKMSENDTKIFQSLVFKKQFWKKLISFKGNERCTLIRLFHI